MNLERLKQGVTNRSMKFINERKGWKTDRKIVVIESDDWGSIRMPNREVYRKMLDAGLRVDNCNYCKNDSLASKDDFEQLYEVLTKHKDSKGNHPIITANTIVANPDFEKIKNNDFKEYFYEPFTETLKKYPNHSFDQWKEGIKNKIFYPQFHGREHLNVNRWLKLLQKPSEEVHLGFNNELFGISSTISNESNPSLMAALDIDDLSQVKDIHHIMESGLTLFEKTFGYKSKSFIAPNYIWSQEIEDLLAKYNVEFFQGGLMQKIPLKENKYNYMGKVNKNNQVYLTRNVMFEPSMLIEKDWVSAAMGEISRAFKQKKPSIICSHRVNYIGGIFEDNRIKNLRILDELLSKIITKWPDVEFMTSVELGSLMKDDLK